MGKIEEFYEELIPILQRFPKVQRYTLAENIEKETLACIRLVFEAAYLANSRLDSLKKLRTRLHMITLLIRVSRKTDLIKTDGIYENLTRKTSEMGKITSGWIKNEEVRLKGGSKNVQKSREQEDLLEKDSADGPTQDIVHA